MQNNVLNTTMNKQEISLGDVLQANFTPNYNENNDIKANLQEFHLLHCMLQNNRETVSQILKNINDIPDSGKKELLEITEDMVNFFKNHKPAITKIEPTVEEKPISFTVKVVDIRSSPNFTVDYDDYN
jgi:hypothetical protein